MGTDLCCHSIAIVNAAITAWRVPDVHGSPNKAGQGAVIYRGALCTSRSLDLAENGLDTVFGGSQRCNLTNE